MNICHLTLVRILRILYGFIILKNCICIILNRILNIRVNSKKNAIGRNVLFGNTPKKLAKIYNNNPKKKVSNDNVFSVVERDIRVCFVKNSEKKLNINEKIPDIMNSKTKKTAYFFISSLIFCGGNSFISNKIIDIQNEPRRVYFIKYTTGSIEGDI